MKLNPHQKSNIYALLILAWGSTAMLGHLLHSKALKGLGLASAAAPYTKVFCQAQSRDGGGSFETFAADFRIHYLNPNGTEQCLPITPELYQSLRGPYQRRNVYGAVLAYGPALPETVQKATLHYALLSPGVIPTEFGIPKDATRLRVTMISRTQGSDHQWTFTPEHTK